MRRTKNKKAKNKAMRNKTRRGGFWSSNKNVVHPEGLGRNVSKNTRDAPIYPEIPVSELKSESSDMGDTVNLRESKKYDPGSGKRAYDAIKEYFSPTKTSKHLLRDLVILTRNAEPYVSSTGKTCFNWLSLDSVMTKKTNIKQKLIDTSNDMDWEWLDNAMPELLQNLYPVFTSITDPAIKREALLLYVFYGVGTSIPQDVVLELCNRLSIDIDEKFTYRTRCNFSYTNIKTGASDNMPIAYSGNPADKYYELLNNYKNKLTGTEYENNSIVRGVIDNITGLSPKYINYLLSQFPTEKI